MPAQRFKGTPNQTVITFESSSAAGLDEHVQQFLNRYHVRIVAQSAYATIVRGQITHYALVTFDDEPGQGF